MASEISTIQSLKAVDAWIDVINANINGGVRTAFKSSRLKFAGSNVDVSRAGSSTSLPLQFPEPGLTTANTVIDFSQGAVTASTENTHLAIQGDGFFLVASPDAINVTAGATFGTTKASSTARFLLTRDGEFHTDANGLLVNANGFYLVTIDLINGAGGQLVLNYDTTTQFGVNSPIRPVYNNLDNTTPPVGRFFNLTMFLSNTGLIDAAGTNYTGSGTSSLMMLNKGRQSLKYTSFGSTVFDFGHKTAATTGTAAIDPSIAIFYAYAKDATVLSKSLEASNASMTQSVPELSLAQKLFSALTKVLQTKQTNVDGVLNLVR